MKGKTTWLLLGLFLVACGGETNDSVEAVRSMAENSAATLTLDDWDIEQCKQNLFKRLWDQDQRDAACE